MNPTTFSFPTTIRFGNGTLSELPEHLVRLRISNPLVVTDPGLFSTRAFEALDAILRGQCGIFSSVHPNPLEADVEGAARAYSGARCDGIIAFGGGSAMDVGKALRLRLRQPSMRLREFDSKADWSGLAPCVAIPTTAGTGSEVGRSAVIIIQERKRVIFHPALLPSLVILDPELTRDLPPKLTAATGADALTHCIEAFTSPVFHPLCEGIALEGIALIGKGWVRAVQHGHTDLEARALMQVAAMMGGVAFQKDLGATHAMAHPLSSLCGLHHGLANALCLRAVMELNAQRKPGLYSRVGIALGISNADDRQTIDAVQTLLNETGLVGGLRAQGVTESHLDALVAQAFEDSCHLTNPVPVSAEDLRALYLRSL